MGSLTNGHGTGDSAAVARARSVVLCATGRVSLARLRAPCTWCRCPPKVRPEPLEWCVPPTDTAPLPPASDVLPSLGAPSMRRLLDRASSSCTTMATVSAMTPRADVTVTAIDHGRQKLGIGGDIRPATPVPPTVLATEMDNGALIVQGRPDGPRTYLTPGEAVSLRRELATAFGSVERGLRDGQGEAR